MNALPRYQVNNVAFLPFVKKSNFKNVKECRNSIQAKKGELAIISFDGFSLKSDGRVQK